MQQKQTQYQHIFIPVIRIISISLPKVNVTSGKPDIVQVFPEGMLLEHYGFRQ
ncbi:hypothetical protein Xinn_00596 [Xenorhabdus innexi]|uniref:Uncharacterized protein n=1 Tax=Xenorhabdus innexi TaxID=290109 RepID=A0A2G0NTM8_9GAMM|nr:hypothetical protein Xinn_00596 [Xenorhabdus innexi]